jgi:hypothetical protein
MKIIIALAAAGLALLATSCASDEPAAPADASPTSTSASTPTPEPVTLRETCPEIEAALPGGYLPEADRIATFLGDLASLQEQGDTETKNAIELLRPATATYHDAVATDAPAGDMLDAHSAWLDAISAVAERCKAAGSSALQ